MIPTTKQQMALFVDRSSNQWVVRDAHGSFWTLPSVPNAWDHRVPFDPSDKVELDPIPGHYKAMLGLPG